MKSPRLTVDGVIIKDKKILLIRRKNEPFKGKWALPGGFVDYGERVEDAVIREIKEETGLDTKIARLLGVYSDPERDPRGHTVSIAYLLSPKEGVPEGGDDALEARFFDINELPSLAFDHDKIIKDALHMLSHGM
ncbi:ADP-ribose pyrophosphatase [Thermoplasmatales archaeon ex4484_30]|nr:MAG: ADP-ribose pyrophosphatase [Thermoplasmatales archaeon ex4484_30]RLF46003.1 MAG: ADP-ribose pyrophosphatase [Thermoplasmata archaeon]